MTPTLQVLPTRDEMRAWRNPLRPRCVLCGCHQFDACRDGRGVACHWAGPGLCSSCARLFPPGIVQQKLDYQRTALNPVFDPGGYMRICLRHSCLLAGLPIPQAAIQAINAIVPRRRYLKARGAS